MQPYQIYLNKLDGIKKRFDNELEALGNEVREKLVAPACRKHRLKFRSGQGTFYFCRNTNKTFDAVEPTYGDKKDLYARVPHGYVELSNAAKATLEPILDLLNQEISHRQYIGYLVSDVD